MQVLVSVNGLANIEDRFQAFEKNITEARETMVLVGEAIDAYNKKNWGRGVKDVDTTDQRWPGHKPLDNPEAAQARELAQLKDTFHVKEVSETSVTYGSDDYRARFLQYGTRKMKKKRVLKFPRKAVAKLLQERIFHGVTR